MVVGSLYLGTSPNQPKPRRKRCWHPVIISRLFPRTPPSGWRKIFGRFVACERPTFTRYLMAINMFSSGLQRTLRFVNSSMPPVSTLPKDTHRSQNPSLPSSCGFMNFNSWWMGLRIGWSHSICQLTIRHCSMMPSSCRRIGRTAAWNCRVCTTQTRWDSFRNSSTDHGRSSLSRDKTPVRLRTGVC